MGVTIKISMLIFCVWGVWGKPAGYDYSPPQNEATEVEIQKVEVYEVPWIGDQQPQSGYGPPKEDYLPPSSNYGPPTQEYGPPSQEYGPPSQEYGPPSQEYGPPSQEPEPITETPEPTTISPLNDTTEIVANDTETENARLQDAKGITSDGHYYIYHPNGLLQKVIYSTNDDSENMAFSAKLKYKNVDPITGPIYTYDPSTYVFSRLNKK
ncbi:hypothetical protein GWI33_006532 [Rhynchophorus ferrugineus]|uniref:Uncharacterized protein n=1 Tax=Rhynchophorus ferrugineus TaxID=354439 RepID=A0A834III9_RHYFE|nr:hypothetical protein GWI33_006532 [Rhynchophorus ferrugineus]